MSPSVQDTLHTSYSDDEDYSNIPTNINISTNTSITEEPAVNVEPIQTYAIAHEDGIQQLTDEGVWTAERTNIAKVEPQSQHLYHSNAEIDLEVLYDEPVIKLNHTPM